MDVVLQQLLNAIALASIYALLAVGISLFFGVIGVVNLAHGDIGMIGVFVTLGLLKFLMTGQGWPVQSLAVVLGVVAAGATGVLFYWLALKPLGETSAIVGVLSSIGVSLMLREVLLNLYPDGRNPQPFPEILPPQVLELGGVYIQLKHIAVIAAALAVVILLAWCIERTRFGRATRSLINSREVAMAFGVKVVPVTVAVFVLGSALAGFAAVMNGLYYNLIQADMGAMLTIKGFTAAVVGGLGNMYGALLGALLIGLVEAFTAGYVPDGSAYKDIAVFGILILVLILKPTGLLTKQVAEKV